MRQEIEGVREIIRNRIPYMGVCLGMQVLAKAAGGSVVKAEEKEIGLRTAEGEPYKMMLTGEGKNNKLFEGMPDEFPVFHLHGETVVLPEHAKLLAEGNRCRIQCFVVEPFFYGIQGHLELTEEVLREWLGSIGDFNSVNKEELLNTYLEIRESYLASSRRLFANFLRIAGLLHK